CRPRNLRCSLRITTIFRLHQPFAFSDPILCESASLFGTWSVDQEPSNFTTPLLNVLSPAGIIPAAYREFPREHHEAPAVTCCGSIGPSHDVLRIQWAVQPIHFDRYVLPPVELQHHAGHRIDPVQILN